jgi:hypothetical protein
MACRRAQIPNFVGEFGDGSEAIIDFAFAQPENRRVEAHVLAAGELRIEAGAKHIERKYEIVRMFHPSQNRRSRRVGLNNLTEAEAQAHCHDPRTRVDGVYFDGYQLMKGLR